MRHQIIFGTSVINNEPPTVKDPTVFFPGRAMTGQSGFQINDDIMSKHILLLGGSGCGKTNSFCYTVKALRESMNGEDNLMDFCACTCRFRVHHYDEKAQEQCKSVYQHSSPV